VRGSIIRRNSGSSVVTERNTATALQAANSLSRSISRVTSWFFVIIATGSELGEHLQTAARKFKAALDGWYNQSLR